MKVDGDAHHTSSRLRIKAYSIISRMGRPLTAHEIENLIRINDPQLWSEVTTKCSDYVRIILSFAKETLFQKFKLKKPLPGLDRRTIFYGISNSMYSSDDWSPIEEIKTSPLNIPEQISIISFQVVTAEDAQKSWKMLSQFLPMDDTIWNELLSSIKCIRSEEFGGIDPDQKINKIFSLYPTLLNSPQIDHFLVILSREITLKNPVK